MSQISKVTVLTPMNPVTGYSQVHLVIRMKAVIYRNYGSPEVLRLEEVEKPVPGDDQVLIQVRAASVNPYDWHFMRGSPRVIRVLTGIGRPRFHGLGADIAGEVMAAGPKVTQFKPGDAVYGMGRGAFAEFACIDESHLAIKPQDMTFAQAASIPIAGLTALQAVRDKARVQPGQRVLINGAAGGVGTFAVQMAKWMGAEVAGVCSTRNLELVRSLGADHVIDYTREDFTTGSRRYNAILECVGNRPFSTARSVLTSDGAYVGIGGGGPDRSSISLFGGMLKNTALSWFASQKLTGMMAKANTADLDIISGLVTSGKLTPVIDRQYRLEEVPDAMRYIETGHARGKVVIVI